MALLVGAMTLLALSSGLLFRYLSYRRLKRQHAEEIAKLNRRHALDLLQVGRIYSTGNAAQLPESLRNKCEDKEKSR